MLPLGLESHEVECDTVGGHSDPGKICLDPHMPEPPVSLGKVPSFLITTTETHKCHNWALLKTSFLSSEH